MGLPPGVTLWATALDCDVYRTVNVIQEALESNLAQRERDFWKENYKTLQRRLAESLLREEQSRLREEQLKERIAGMEVKLVLEMEKNGNQCEVLVGIKKEEE
jgi:uncharacterized protein with von Willebrand factor type A (vWA) domain